MRNPRICFVNPPVLLKRPIAELIDMLGRKGFKISLLIPKKLFRGVDKSLHHSRLIGKSKVYSYSVVNFTRSEQPIPFTLMFFINVFKALKNNDIIHLWVPYYLTSLYVILFKKLFFSRKKLILTLDTVPGLSFSMGAFWNTIFRIYNALGGWVLFNTPDIITLYGNSLVPFALKAGIPKHKIRVVSTGINVKAKSLKTNTSIRKELNIKLKTRIVLFVGLVIPRKGIKKIISMAYKMRKEDVVFLIAGDGLKRKIYEKQALEAGLKNKVFFLGWRKDLDNLYQSSDILVLPSDGEGLPGVVMEAMTHKLPCIASNIPCIPDLIDENTGFLCNKDNVNEFVQKIRYLMKNKEKKNKMGLAGLKKIKEFEWSKILKKYEKIYIK